MVVKRWALVIGVLVVLGGIGRGDADDAMDIQHAEETIAVFKRVDPDIARYIDSAVGYAVFPTIGKGAVGIGGAGGSGIVFERGKPIGKASLTQVTIGAQFGGQTYSEIIFFGTPAAFTDFKKGTLVLAAQVSAVAGAANVVATADYQNGVAVFTTGKGGLMFEASVGWQRFDFQPFGMR